jgi:ABC-2 type transport system permease protein
MKTFINFIHKEFLHILRDRRTLIIVLVIPVVQIILFGFAITNEVKDIRIAILPSHHDEVVRKVAEALKANQYFVYEGYLNDAKQMDDGLKSGSYDAVLRYMPNQKPLWQLVIDATNPNNANIEQAYLTALLSDATAGDMAQQPLLSVNQRMLYNPQVLSSYNFVPGVMGLIFIIICAIMTSVSIAREKETGTMEILLVSPVRSLAIIIAKMIPYLAISCINLVTILLLARYVLGIPVENNAVSISFVSLLYIVLSLSLGLLISTLAKRQVVAMIMAIIIVMLPVIMLSGMLFPIENMPGWLQYVSFIVPARWYISAIRALMIEGLPIVSVLREIFILTAMTIGIIALSLHMFRIKLD